MSVFCEFCGAPTDWMTTAQVARLFGVSQTVVRKYIKQGRFPGTMKVAGMTSPMSYKIPAAAVIPLIEAKNGETKEG